MLKTNRTASQRCDRCDEDFELLAAPGIMRIPWCQLTKFFSMLKKYECDWLNVIPKKTPFSVAFYCVFRVFFGYENIFVRLQAIFNFHVSMIATFSYQLNASFRNCDRIQRTIKCKLLLIDWLRCEQTTVHFFLLIQYYWKYNGFNRIHP